MSPRARALVRALLCALAWLLFAVLTAHVGGPAVQP